MQLRSPASNCIRRSAVQASRYSCKHWTKQHKMSGTHVHAATTPPPPPDQPGDSPASMAGPPMDTRSQRERMLAGDLYYSFVPDLTAERHRAIRLLRQYNHTIDPSDAAGQLAVLKQLLGSVDESSPPYITPPFTCDYGSNIHLGADVYMNFGCCILDAGPVHIGARTLFAPNVQSVSEATQLPGAALAQLYPATHPVDPAIRQGIEGPEYGLPITIGSDCWIGGSAIILGGVTIGDGSVVGAGSVVTKNVAPGMIVAGNPARVLRTVAEAAAQQAFVVPPRPQVATPKEAGAAAADLAS